MIIDAVKTGRKAGTVTQEENMKYDYLIVGAGLFGAVFAREITDQGKKCLVIEKKRSYCRQHLYRRGRWDSCSSLWCTHFPHF